MTVRCLQGYCAHRYLRTYIHTNIWLRVCVCVPTQTLTGANTYTCKSIYICVCVHTRNHLYTHDNMCNYNHRCVYMCVYIYTRFIYFFIYLFVYLFVYLFIYVLEHAPSLSVPGAASWFCSVFWLCDLVLAACCSKFSRGRPSSELNLWWFGGRWPQMSSLQNPCWLMIGSGITLSNILRIITINQ